MAFLCRGSGDDAKGEGPRPARSRWRRGAPRLLELVKAVRRTRGGSKGIFGAPSEEVLCQQRLAPKGPEPELRG